jgi:hypothetical protein
MANTVTSLTNIPVVYSRQGDIIRRKLVYDTVDTDVTIYTPTGRNMVLPKAIDHSLNQETTMKIKLEDGSYHTINLAPYQGRVGDVSRLLYFPLPPGQPLIVQFSTTITSMMFFLQESATCET